MSNKTPNLVFPKEFPLKKFWESINIINVFLLLIKIQRIVDKYCYIFWRYEETEQINSISLKDNK